MFYVLYRWLRAPIPARKVTVWREIVPAAAGIFVLLALSPSAQWRARIAMAGIGLLCALMSISRPRAIWDSQRVIEWRELFGDRLVWLIYVGVGILIIAFSGTAQVHP